MFAESSLWSVTITFRLAIKSLESILFFGQLLLRKEFGKEAISTSERPAVEIGSERHQAVFVIASS